MKILLLILIVAAPLISFQVINNMEDEITYAHLNAKKGVYFGLKNVKSKKIKFDSKLIDRNKLIATVKVSKEINGVKVESTGFHHSTEVSIIVYRSYSDLVKDGYLKDASDFPSSVLHEDSTN